jgi:hypothetical protein
MIYALGYFNHVLYQYDCRTGANRSVAVGALGGHISRNFFCDHQGHVYVPRLGQVPGTTQMRTTLVELDSVLREVAESPIRNYTQTRDEDSHGIVAFQPLADRSIVFATDQGYLHRLVPQEESPADVEWLGWFHPQRRAYVASLFTSDGQRHLMGMTVRTTPEGTRLEWLVFDLAARISDTVPVPMPAPGGQPLENPLVYGSITRDNEGNCYLGGAYSHAGRMLPLLLQVRRSPDQDAPQSRQGVRTRTSRSERETLAT